MEQRYCQSCGMPLSEAAEAYGTNADGSKNEDYCKYCFENGAYTYSYSMDELIEFCIQPMIESNPGMQVDEARAQMRIFFPTLKRWKQT